MPGWRGASLLAAALALGLALRLAPLAVTGMPFDCDSWYIHHDVRVLEARPTARAYSDPGLDGYHNRWPAAMLNSLILKTVTGARGVAGAHAAGPLLDGLAVVPLYALARRLGARPLHAGLAALTVSATPSMALLGGGLVKEAVARPLLYTYPLAALAGARASYPLLALGLSLSHHLTAATLAGALALSHPIARILGAAAGRRLAEPDPLATAALAAAAAGYNAAVGWGFLRGALGAVDAYWLAVYVAAIFPAVAVGPGLWRGGRALEGLLAAGVVAGLVALAALAGLAPGVQASPTLLAYAAPPLLLVPLAAGLAARDPPRGSPLPLAWVALLAAVTGYLALAGTPMGQSPAGRVANLTIPGLALAAALSGSRRLLPLAAAAAIALGPLMVYASLSGLDPESFDLPYHHYEASTVAYALEGGAGPLYGDAKVRDLAYYLSGGVGVAEQAYPRWGPGYLALYRENLRWGLKLNSNLHTGNPNPLREALHGAGGVSLVYNTGESWLLASQSPQAAR